MLEVKPDSRVGSLQRDGWLWNAAEELRPSPKDEGGWRERERESPLGAVWGVDRRQDGWETWTRAREQANGLTTCMERCRICETSSAQNQEVKCQGKRGVSS